MPKFLYRFRSVESLLGTHEELEKQEIYFASTQQLNDPMEGYKNIFWDGDNIIWKNFLCHYLLCLHHVCIIFSLVGESEIIEDKNINPFNNLESFPTNESRHIYEEIKKLFYNNEKIKNYPEWLASRKTPIKRNELLVYLKHLHHYALACIHTVYEENGLLQGDAGKNLLEKSLNPVLDFVFFDNVNKLEEENSKISDAADKFFSILMNVQSQLDLSIINDKNFSQNLNRRLLYLEFPEKYLKNLEKIVHHDWYAACFLENYSNPAMWGYYGDSRRGVCLKFKTPHNIENNPTLSLQSITSYSGGRSGDIRPGYNDVKHVFHKVIYDEKHPSIDFFRSLGLLPIPVLNQTWFMSETKEISTCAESMFTDEEKWHQEYWKTFIKNNSIKLKGWFHEVEYRLVLYSFLTDYSDPNSRKLKYDFKELEGIIFGIKTSSSDKIKIIEIIKRKCKEHNRSDFKFFQAYYSEDTEDIKLAELNLL